MTQSITNRAMLVSLNIQQWSGSRHDKQVSREVADTHNSDVSMGRYQKLLVAKTALETLRKLSSAARLEHYKRTLPWSDEGARILSSQGYFDYSEKMRELRAQWDVAVAEFIAQYPQVVQDARARLNGLFKDEDYPSIAKLEQKFGFQTAVVPMPDAADFRVDLGDQETARVRSEIETSVNDSLRLAMADVWKRLFSVVSHMAERLAAYQVTNEGVSNPFRDSLVDNVRELIAILPTLNITSDADVARIAAEIEQKLCRYTADELRESDTARTETALQAEAILKTMSDFI